MSSRSCAAVLFSVPFLQFIKSLAQKPSKHRTFTLIYFSFNSCLPSWRRRTVTFLPTPKQQFPISHIHIEKTNNLFTRSLILKASLLVLSRGNHKLINYSPAMLYLGRVAGDYRRSEVIKPSEAFSEFDIGASRLPKLCSVNSPINCFTPLGNFPQSRSLWLVTR